MKEAQFEYRCRRCNEISRNPCCDEGLAMSLLTTAVILSKGQIFGRSDQTVSLRGTHLCEDGGMGCSDLVGYSVVDTGGD